MGNGLPKRKQHNRHRIMILMAAAALAETAVLICLSFFIKTNILIALVIALSFQIPMVIRRFMKTKKARAVCRICSVILLTGGAIGCLACHGRNYYIESMTEADNKSVDVGRYEPFNDMSAIGRLDEEPELVLTGNLPVLNGSAFLLPLYSSVIDMIYPETIAGLNEKGSPYRFTDTEDAYQELFSGKTDVVFSEEPSEDILKAAKNQGLVLETVSVGWDAFVFFTNSSNTVTELTRKELRDIYSGQAVNWSEFGGEDMEIAAYQCSKGSCAQERLEEFMGDTMLMEPRQKLYLDSEEGITETASTYANDSGAIGFSFFYSTRSLSVDMGINLLAVDGVFPDKENISSGLYPLSDSIYCVTVKGHVSENTRRLIDWITSSQGQRLVEAAGYAPN